MSSSGNKPIMTEAQSEQIFRQVAKKSILDLWEQYYRVTDQNRDVTANQRRADLCAIMGKLCVMRAGCAPELPEFRKLVARMVGAMRSDPELLFMRAGGTGKEALSASANLGGGA